MAATVDIYALIDPSIGMVRYIGKANDAIKRLATHIRDSRRRNTPVYCWIRTLAAVGQRPDLIVLSECAEDAWEQEERRLIASARTRGLRLLNVADGGGQPPVSVETCRANAALLNARMAADPLMRRVCDIKRQLAFGLRNGHVTDSTKEVLRQAAAKCPRLFGEYASL